MRSRAAICALLLSAPVLGDTFGSGDHEFTIEFLTIGAAGNSPDVSGFGAAKNLTLVGDAAIVTDPDRGSVLSLDGAGDYGETAANTAGDRRLAGFLASLEPLLIEIAYQAHTASSTARDRMQAEVRNDLLFKIRVMNTQLKNSRVSA